MDGKLESHANSHLHIRFYDLRRAQSTTINDHLWMVDSTQNLFGRRLRAARMQACIAQDRLGVLIGFDEGASSARMSRYESGVHAPPFVIAEKIAAALMIPVEYFYCPNDIVASLLLEIHGMSNEQLSSVLKAVKNIKSV